MTLSADYIQPIEAQYRGNITINIDGSISPSTAPIQQRNSFYYVTSDVVGSITVRAGNIVLDGDGHDVSGVSLRGAINVTVRNFVVLSQGETVGMSLSDASNNVIINNTVTGFESIQAMNGILFAGIYVVGGNSNVIAENNLIYNLYGMEFANTSCNLIRQNNITSNPIWNLHGPYSAGVSFIGASQNTIYHNNFVNSTSQAKSMNSVNTWDNGFPDGGNYWSDYQTKYPSASVIENSGIGNTPYYIDEQNRDNYPLMELFSAVPPTENNPIPTSSNGSVPEDFPTALVTTVSVITGAIVGVGLIFYFKKRKH
jgi:parallel beta-helix repeat protein